MMCHQQVRMARHGTPRNSKRIWRSTDVLLLSTGSSTFARSHTPVTPAIGTGLAPRRISPKNFLILASLGAYGTSPQVAIMASKMAALVAKLAIGQPTVR